jgi:hypothetical protein
MAAHDWNVNTFFQEETMTFAKLLRIVLGGMYLVGALMHLYFALFSPQAYAGLAQSALIPLYRMIFSEIVPPYAIVFGIIAAAVELGVGILILSSGSTMRWGLGAATALQILLAPLGFWGFANVALAVVQTYVLTSSFEKTVYVEQPVRVHVR